MIRFLEINTCFVLTCRPIFECQNTNETEFLYEIMLRQRCIRNNITFAEAFLTDLWFWDGVAFLVVFVQLPLTLRFIILVVFAGLNFVDAILMERELALFRDVVSKKAGLTCTWTQG